MKKTLVTMLAAIAVAASSYGQGTVTFNNTAAAIVQQRTSPVNSALISVPANGGKVELLWAPVGTTDLGLFTPVGAVVNITPTAGRFTGGTRTIPAGTGLSGIVAGGQVALAVRGWTGTAASWNLVDLGTQQVGYSSIFTLTTGNPTTVPAGTPTAIVGNGFTGLQLAYVPEPTSMTLAGLGAAALLAFRRRK